MKPIEPPINKLDYYDNNQYRNHTTKSESVKAINTLKGILTGINLDGDVNENELKELNQWCFLNHSLINRNPFKEAIDLIQEANKSIDLRHESLLDLLWICDNYLENNKYYDIITQKIQILHGICHGIISDGIINETEIYELEKWLNEHIYLNNYYPYDEIRSLLMAVLSDHKIDENEKKRLLAYFNEFSKITNQDILEKIKSETIDISLSGICSVEPNIIFKGKTFCFTGIAQRATRAELKTQIESLEGYFIDIVTNNTDYLIVGNNGNLCWAFACYGRKVEKAMLLRKNGNPISIIHEFDFWDFVEDYKALNQ